MKVWIAGCFLLLVITSINAYVTDRDKVKRQTVNIGFQTTLPRKETVLLLDSMSVVKLTGTGTNELSINGTVTCNFNSNVFTIMTLEGTVTLPVSISSCYNLLALQLTSATAGQVSFMGVGTVYYDTDSVLFIDKDSSGVSDIIASRRAFFPPAIEVLEFLFVARLDQLVLNLDNTNAPDGTPETMDDGIRMTGAMCINLLGGDSIVYKNRILTVFRGSTVLSSTSSVEDFEVVEEVVSAGISCLNLSRHSISRGRTVNGPGLLCTGTSNLGGGRIGFFTNSGGFISDIEEGVASNQLAFAASSADNTATISGRLSPNQAQQFLEINQGSQFSTLENAAELQQNNGVIVISDRFGNLLRQFGVPGSGSSLAYYDNRVQYRTATGSLDTVTIPEGGVNIISSEVGGSRMLFAYPASNGYVSRQIDQLQSGINVQPSPPINFEIMTSDLGVMTLSASGEFVIGISSSTSAGVGLAQCSDYSMSRVTILNNCDAASPASRFSNINTAQVHNSAANSITTFNGNAGALIPGGGQWFFSGDRAFYTNDANLISNIQRSLSNAPSVSVGVASMVDANGTTIVNLRSGGSNFFMFGEVVNTDDVGGNQALLYASGNLGSANVVRVPSGGSLEYIPASSNIRILAAPGSDIQPRDVQTMTLLAPPFPGGDLSSITTQTMFPGGGTLYLGNMGHVYLLDDRVDNVAFNTVSGFGGLIMNVRAPSLSFFDGQSVQMFTDSSMNALFGPGTLYESDGQYFYTTSSSLINSIPSRYAELRPPSIDFSMETETININTAQGTTIASLPIQSNTEQIPSGEGITLAFSMNNLSVVTGDTSRLISNLINMITFFDGVEVTMVLSPDSLEFTGGGLLIYDDQTSMAFYTTEQSTIRRIDQALADVVSTFVGPTIPVTQPVTFMTEASEVNAGFGQLLTVHEGATVNLRCTAGNANPTATFSFFQRNGTGPDSGYSPALDNPDNLIIMNGPNDVTLQLTDVMQDPDSPGREYKCTASNLISTVSRNTRVTVLPGEAPTIDNNFFSGRTSPGEIAVTARSVDPKLIIPTLEPDSSTVIDDQSLLTNRVTIRCKANGPPEPSITWMRRDNFGPAMVIDTSLSTFNITSPGPGESLLTVALGPTDTHCFEYICSTDNGIGVGEVGTAQVCPERFSVQGSEIPGMCSSTCGIGIQRSVFNYIRAFNDTSATVTFDQLPEGLVKPIVRFCSNEDCPLEEMDFTTSEFGECSEFCGVGIQTRMVTCSRLVDGEVDSDTDLPDDACIGVGRTRPSEKQNCNTFHCPRYAVGPYDACSRTCRGGTQMREFTCEGFFSISDDGLVSETENITVLDDEICSNYSKEEEPQTMRMCNEQILCPVRFLPTEFGPCDQSFCQRRTFTCVNFDPSDPTEEWPSTVNVCEEQGLIRPHSVRSCGGGACSSGRWNSSFSEDCSALCGIGTQNIDVVCVNPNTGVEIEEGFCDARQKPETSRQCLIRNCPGQCEFEPEVCSLVRQLRLCKLELTVIPQCCKSCPLQATPIPNL